jgi:hypothetical protein
VKFRICLSRGLILLAFAGILVYYGCNNESEIVAPRKLGLSSVVANDDYIIHETDSINHKIYQAIVDSAGNHAIFAANTSDPNVASAMAVLIGRGYSLMEPNSVVLIESHYLDDFNDGVTFPNRGKVNPVFYGKRVIWADTVVWLAFENPSKDSAIHTAIVTNIVNGVKKTVFLELNVGTQVPHVSEQGLIIDGQFQPGDIGAMYWAECVAGGLAATGVTCLFSNCGYLHCAAVGTVGTLVGCTVGWLWGKIF